MSGAGCRVPGAGCRVPGAGCRVSGARCQVPRVGCQVPRVGCQVSGVGCSRASTLRARLPGTREAWTPERPKRHVPVHASRLVQRLARSVDARRHPVGLASCGAVPFAGIGRVFAGADALRLVSSSPFALRGRVMGQATGRAPPGPRPVPQRPRFAPGYRDPARRGRRSAQNSTPRSTPRAWSCDRREAWTPGGAESPATWAARPDRGSTSLPRCSGPPPALPEPVPH
jgi:hypothetical protein